MNALPAPVRDAIRERRVHLGLTQEEAAAAGGVSGATWRSIEKGRSAGSNLVRASMCKALGWTIDSIDRLERGDTATAPATTEDHPDPGDDSIIVVAIKELTSEVGRLSDELGAQRNLIDRLVAAELDRRRQ